MMKVAVIGGGPAGLATLKFLSKAHEYFPIPPIKVQLFEAEAQIGGTFVYRVYEDAELVSSKYLTAFSDFRLPKTAPDFITPKTYVEYLNNYVDEFELRHLIHCEHAVRNVERGNNGVGHIVTVSKPDGSTFAYACDAVALCTGLNVVPRIPKIIGMERVPLVIHSSELRGREQFGEDTEVVVLGGGETAMDAAHLAITSPTKSVTLCHRAGFYCAPKIIPLPGPGGKPYAGPPNKPVDTSVASLFDTAYAHPVLQHSPLLWLAYDQWVKRMLWFIGGTQEGPDQWVGHMASDRKHLDSVILCKSDRALPYISAGHRSQSLWNRIRSTFVNVPIRDNHGRHIDVKGWPALVDKDGYMHIDGEEKKVRPDVMVFGTGYNTAFPFLSNEYPALCNTNVRGIYREGDVTVGFIGFVRPNFGAIPPLAELQAQLWVLRLLQHHYPNAVPTARDPNAVAPYEMDYKLHPRAGFDLFSDKRAVDHESYAYQLALDMGAAANITHVMSKGWKVFFTWAMGSNFNPKFRIVGPWRRDLEATRVMRTELYDIVKRSGGFLYILTYTIIPFFVFGTISGLLYAFFGLIALFVWISQAVASIF